MSDPSDPSSYTVGWVCALSTEFTAAQEQFDEEYEPHESPEHREANDSNVYSFGKIKGHMVVVAVMPNGQYGTASAATVAKDMIRSFRNIRFGLMVGIGGGAPTKQHDIRLGDVVVSSPTPGQSGVFQYDFGKATKEGFQHTASHNKPPPLLLAAVAGLKTQHERKGLQIHEKVSTIVTNNKRLRAKYGRPDDPDSLFAASVKHKSDPCHESCVTTPTDLVPRMPREEPMEDVEVHYGTIASGNTLIKDAAKRDELASKASILCFEMEAAGLMDGFRCLVVRGICDYCDSHKNDKWQGYAAMTAAIYAKQILGMIRPEAVAREEIIILKIDEVLHTVISGVKDLKRSITEQEVLDWLSDEDFGAYQFDERSKKAPGTCQWFLDLPEYQSWIQEKGQVLFCPGIAGAGKTVLASAIIEDLHSRFQRDSSTAILHIYCRYNRVDRQTFNDLRASLLRQLCELLSPLPEGIMQLYDQYKPRRTGPPPERVLSELESVSGQFFKVFLVVDALDEWATEHGDLYSLPAELLLLQTKSAINLLTTSRPVPLIAHQFRNYPSISITAQQQDIYAYVDNFRWPDSSCIGKMAALRGLVRKVMSQTVRGMFLLARLYLYSLENETTERDVKDALRRFENRAKNENDSKFNIVDQAYNDTLKRFREQHQNFSDLAYRVLAWICCTCWNLSVGAIQHGLALREGDTAFREDGIVDEALLLSVCCGLIEIPQGSREIRLVHYTAESFFRHNRHLLDEYFLARHSIDLHLPSNADAYLARQCATCLSIGLPRHRPEGISNEPRFPGSLWDSFKPNLAFEESSFQSDDSSEERFVETDPSFEDSKFIGQTKEHDIISLYAYSAFSWGGHVRRLSPADQAYDTSIELLQKREIFGRAVESVLTLGDRSEKKDVLQNSGALHLAALFGLGNLAESLVRNLDIESRDSCGQTALVWTLKCLAFRYKIKPVRRLFATPDFNIYSGIHIDRRRIVMDLLGSGANPNIAGYNGDTALHFAAMLGDVEIVEKLLEREVDIHRSNSEGNIPVIEAVRHGNESVYMKLLGRGAVDDCGENGRTALIEAASVGDLALVEKLIKNGAKVRRRDRKGKNALIEASRSGHARIVELLLPNQSDVDHQDHWGSTALMEACTGGHADIIELLLAANARLDIRNCINESALDLGARHCGEVIMKRLFHQITDPSIQYQHSCSALVIASEHQRPHIVSLILEDAEIKPASKYIDLALSKSYHRGSEEVVKLLISHEANPNLEFENDVSLKPLLMHAIYARSDAVALLLLEAGIDIEAEDDVGEGPIHAAVRQGNKTMVLSLLEKGFSVNRRSRSGLLPLDLAMRYSGDDRSMANFLREHGAITEAQRLVRFMRSRMKRFN
ncbi:ankyrin protein [Fusarium globosum]|uniref:Ankyrin protein n=1 Tax=Fusarium globosum TaxID=78864 RepID=A0A8H6DG43_9HYPO|nr:ankyrin protein [Fusarium globosum]